MCCIKFVYHLSQSSICKIESNLLCSHCYWKRTSHLTSSPWPPPTQPPKVIRGTYLSLYKEQAGGGEEEAVSKTRVSENVFVGPGGNSEYAGLARAAKIDVLRVAITLCPSCTRAAFWITEQGKRYWYIQQQNYHSQVRSIINSDGFDLQRVLDILITNNMSPCFWAPMKQHPSFYPQLSFYG